jgi:hypothetical protein
LQLAPSAFPWQVLPLQLAEAQSELLQQVIPCANKPRPLHEDPELEVLTHA